MAFTAVSCVSGMGGGFIISGCLATTVLGLVTAATGAVVPPIYPAEVSAPSFGLALAV